MDENALLNFAVSVGKIMLKNGAETHRVEDTIERILSTEENSMPETFITPTGIFASIQSPIVGNITKLCRISDYSINLEKVTMANSLSRDFVNKKISLEEGFKKLETIENLADFPDKIVVLSYGIVCACFAFIFKGTPIDAVVAFLSGTLLGIISLFFTKRGVTSFLISLVKGFFVAFFAISVFKIMPYVNYEIVITGSIMPLVPGVATTNAVRDVMNRDFLSGACRLLEASIVAVSVATGVLAAFSVFDILGGV